MIDTLPMIPTDARARIVAFLIRTREDAHMSQTQLASVLDMGQSDISKIERLERRIDTTECLQWLHATTTSRGGDTAQLWRDLYDYVVTAKGT